MKAVTQLNPYNQTVVLQGYGLGGRSPAYFAEQFKKDHNIRVKFGEEVLTLPDQVDGVEVRNTGGRSDILFYVHDDDVLEFARIKLELNCRWWEDISYNDYQYIYPQEILDKYPFRW